MNNKQSQGEPVNNRVDRLFGATAINPQHRAAFCSVSSNQQRKIVSGDRLTDSVQGSVIRVTVESRR